MDTKKLISEGYKLFATGNLNGLLERYQDDAELINPESDYLPMASSYHGKKEIADYFMKLNETIQCVSLEPKTMVAEGDTVVVTGDSRWIARSTGIAYDNPFVHVFKIRDDKVLSQRAYYDTSKLEHALHPATTGQAAGKPLHH
ncbi:nuclear transport factor 2 family protein [Pseudoduganella sp. OTU4001]|uniref:nuclear transport factor 2 family protein n=1 Tax=Pseudoduganella sp. OTU4001 TaxID=3043854 RepID=UPI00313E7F0C